MRGRRTDDEDVIQKRMALVDNELDAARLFDFAIVNDDLEVAVQQVLEVIAAVRAGRASDVAGKHGRERVLASWEAQAGL